MSFLQIASWNIEHLSGHPRAQRRQSAFALADHIEMAGIDLLALQEVYVTPSDEEVRLAENQPALPFAAHADHRARRNADLDVVCHLLEEHLEVPWTYAILPNRQAGDRSQLCAAMWSANRLDLRAVRRLAVQHEVDGTRLWDRAPHLLSFETKVRMWVRGEDGEWRQEDQTRGISVVPLHMKANTQGATVPRRIRGLEAETLCEALEAAEGEYDPSLVLLGDTNVLRNDEPAIETFVDHGLVDLNNNDATTYWSKDYGESPFDRIFVAGGRREFRYTRQYVLRSSDLQRHDRFLSDHYMVKASVKDYVDEADPRT